MLKKLTIVDIARLSGVGKSTVSRVLTNDPKVKPETREKVEKVIAENGFVPSKSAQLMRGGSQKVIGVIISRLDSPSENKVVGSILNTLYAAGYDVVVMESQFNKEKTNEHLDVLKKRNVDGVIVFGFTDCDLKKIEEWQHKAIVIALDTQNTSSINYDNHGIIQLAFDHLRQQGVNNIAYLGVDPKDKTTGEMRLNAYLIQCQLHGVTPCYQTGQLNHESAYQLIDELVTPDTHAIICASDTIAFGAIKRLQEINREEIAITGVGGNALLSFLFPNIYSINPGYAEAGESAAKQLIAQLSGESTVTHLIQAPLLSS
ncbi:trehalose operon repressor TreR [Aliivibrio kagoshimensis]|uniref:trehalose operon repressor TreR n=1 Tax=Aliivibrio kagoshimensis TaxID=2910230 RepID=UPI003D09F7CA